MTRNMAVANWDIDLTVQIISTLMRLGNMDTILLIKIQGLENTIMITILPANLMINQNSIFGIWYYKRHGQALVTYI